MKYDRHHPSRKFALQYGPLFGVGAGWCSLTAVAAISFVIAIYWLLTRDLAN